MKLIQSQCPQVVGSSCNLFLENISSHGGLKGKGFFFPPLFFACSDQNVCVCGQRLEKKQQGLVQKNYWQLYFGLRGVKWCQPPLSWLFPTLELMVRPVTSSATVIWNWEGFKSLVHPWWVFVRHQLVRHASSWVMRGDVKTSTSDTMGMRTAGYLVYKMYTRTEKRSSNHLTS